MFCRKVYFIYHSQPVAPDDGVEAVKWGGYRSEMPECSRPRDIRQTYAQASLESRFKQESRDDWYSVAQNLVLVEPTLNFH